MSRIAILATIGALLALPDGASADVERCRLALLREPARYVRTALRLRARCERAQGVDPAVCATDPATSVGTAVARAKAEARIASRCCGPDHDCGTSDDESLPALGWTAATCPGFASAACVAPVDDPGALASCLTCTATFVMDQMAETVAARLAAPGGATALADCQAALVDASTTLLGTHVRALERCWEDRARGKHPNSCPEPGNGKVGPALAAAATDFARDVCRACGGDDGACDGSGDLTPAGIGFVPDCPGVAKPGGGTCAGSVVTLADLVDCVACVTGVATDCATRLPAPTFGAYPAECTAAPTTLQSGVMCATTFDCPAGYECLETAAGTRYCVGLPCASDATCTAAGICRPYCTLTGCGSSRCQSPGFGCVGADVLCLDDGGLACRMICTQDSDCVDPYGLVCVNPGFGFGVCIGNVPCQ